MAGTNTVASLKKLVRDKREVEDKARQVATVERRLIHYLERVLSGAGYRLLPVERNHGRASGPTVMMGRAKVKRLRCPECDRRFAHPLPMARHMSATHGLKKHGSSKRK